jgi:2-iminobutanoate/2-iminopropanoate deaminase
MKIIETAKAPKAIGPYSQAIVIGKMVYTSGVIAINPTTGVIDDTTIEGQTHRALCSLEAILSEAGSSMDQVVKTTVFIKDMNEFPIINRIYEEHFKKHKPARSTVEVARLPKDAKIEIEAVAMIV